jgi:hypothetical protein
MALISELNNFQQEGLLIVICRSTFFLDKKSSKKIKPNRMGDSFMMRLRYDLASGTHDFTRALVQGCCCVFCGAQGGAAFSPGTHGVRVMI